MSRNGSAGSIAGKPDEDDPRRHATDRGIGPLASILLCRQTMPRPMISQVDRRQRRFVIVTGVALGALAAELVVVAARAVSLGWVTSAVLGLAAGAAVATLFIRKSGAGASAPAHGWALVVFAILSLRCVVQTARAGAFMLRPEQPGSSLWPSNRFLVHHNCFTAYYEATRLVGQVPNIYDPAVYLRPPHRASPRPAWQPPSNPQRTIDTFTVDSYEYPPPFLLLLRPAIAAGASFSQARAGWFVFQAVTVILALLAVAWHLGGSVGWRFGLLAPLIYLSLPIQMALQMSNFQIAALALCLIALVAIARGRLELGAGLLSFVILTKLFPGILLLVFAARRQWRALVLTCLGVAVWIGLAVLIFGPAPFETFLGFQLPRIASGEAFHMLNIPMVAAINQSVFGIPLKLAFFGISGGSFHAAAVLAWIYSMVLGVLTWVLGRRLTAGDAANDYERASGLLLGTLVLVLATYRAPFLPQEYGAIGPLWVLGVLAALRPLSPPRMVMFAAAWLLVQVYAPWLSLQSPAVASLIVAVAQLAAAAVLVAAVRRCLRARAGRALPLPDPAAIPAA